MLTVTGSSRKLDLVENRKGASCPSGVILITVQRVGDRFETARILVQLRGKLDFEILVLLAPKWQARHPVFAVDGLPSSGPFAGRKYAGGSVEI